MTLKTTGKWPRRGFYCSEYGAGDYLPGERQPVCRSMYTEFVVEDQKICAALIRASSQEETIRVLLSCDGYTGYIHSGVTLTSSVPFWTVCQGERREYQAGEMLTIDLSALAGQPSMTVFTSATAGTIEILSLNRSQGHPRYRGALEIIADDQGLVLVMSYSWKIIYMGSFPVRCQPPTRWKL